MKRKFIMGMVLMTITTTLSGGEVTKDINIKNENIINENIIVERHMLLAEKTINESQQEVQAVSEEPEAIEVESTSEVINHRTYIENIAYQAANKNDLPEGLVIAVIAAESNFDYTAIGPDTQLGNAFGLMQLLPSTAEEVGVVDIFDPEDNINGGTKYLKMMIDRYNDKNYYDQNGNLLTPYEMGVMAYNWGYPNLDIHMSENCGAVVIAENSEYAIPKETYYYLMKIRDHYNFNEYYNK